MKISSEALAYWYFRLNGFLTTVNFLVHPETTRDSRTDVDILGVRFPFRAENLSRPMDDDRDALSWPLDRPYVIFAEVKTGRCALNGPWTNPESRNMQKVLVLSAIGILPGSEITEAAHQLYSTGTYSGSGCTVSLVCVGRYEQPELRPQVPQLKWDHILEFIYRRFRAYRVEKAQHSQWDQDGKRLWRVSEQSPDIEDFRGRIEVVPPGLPRLKATAGPVSGGGSRG